MSEQKTKKKFYATFDQFTLSESGSPCVGVCLSGGGSRALVAGMGQLRALKHLGLLEKTAALSTVSGGSWVGATFSYIKPDVSDDTYLNKYVANQETLTPHGSKDTPPETILDYLPDKNIAARISQDFNMLYLAFEAFWLYFHDKVETSMIWQTIVGSHILKPYQLFTPGKKQTPSTTFSYNRETQNSILAANPELHKGNIDLCADILDPQKTKRPFLICNASMFVKTEQNDFSYLAPVQSTPLLTGINSTPAAVDANNKQVGGGGVTSFAFSSLLHRVDHNHVEVMQDHQYALMDSIGTSSAFFAEFLQNTFTRWSTDPKNFVEDLHSLEQEKIQHIQKYYPDEKNENILEKIYVRIKHNIENNTENTLTTLLSSLAIDDKKFRKTLMELKNIIPQYYYWPVKDATPDLNIVPTRFADGGNLENTGINALLSYPRITRIIVFVNSETALSVSHKGIFDKNGHEIPNTRIKIDSQIPPLFGYQPYNHDDGYVLFKGNEQSIFKHCQAFEAEMFADLIQKLATAVGKNLNSDCAIAKMNLNVIANKWFGIPQRKPIQLLLVYLNRTKKWYNELSTDVQAILGDVNDPESYHNFPHYSTITQTELSPTEANLLAHFTAWTVAAPPHNQLFKEIYCS